MYIEGSEGIDCRIKKSFIKEKDAYNYLLAQALNYYCYYDFEHRHDFMGCIDVCGYEEDIENANYENIIKDIGECFFDPSTVKEQKENYQSIIDVIGRDRWEEHYNKYKEEIDNDNYENVGMAIGNYCWNDLSVELMTDTYEYERKIQVQENVGGYWVETSELL